MKGGFICPHCKTQNACSCATCKPFIKEGEFISQWTDDGEFLICGNCNKTYNLDQAISEEYKTFNTK